MSHAPKTVTEITKYERFENRNKVGLTLFWSKIATALWGMANTDCITAFAAAGLDFPSEALTTGMTIFAASLLRSKTNLGEMGLDSNSEADDKFRIRMLDVLNEHEYTNDITTPPELAHKGRLYMALTKRAFLETDGPFAVSFVHAWMHAARAHGRKTHPETFTTTRIIPAPWTNPPFTILQTTEVREVANTEGQHDLTWMDKGKYDAIIKNCTK